ncbi:hypothetical protein FB45DRAFT_1058309 [Roridomyces roridus]|uniref:MYND-type domain-containing protein n=1 Tax=Roridomyces roridus TaxID=1738132 RepID=A0AAD7BTH7_9AGAR|nr:hypothetical protein FB45DRAFT_1058309 [Roridomyces roridus]
MSLEIRAFIYGGDDTRCQVVLRKDIPEQAQNNFAMLDGWAQKSVIAIGVDLKHTQRWTCEECGKPARETWFDPRPSLRVSSPVVVLPIHHLCEAGGGACHAAVETRVRGTPPAPSVRPSMPDGSPIPLAGSCAKCQRDETAEEGFKMSRCSKCKLTRYCSAGCQKEDWTRHSRTCKTIQGVQWFNWDEPEPESEDETLKMPGAFV